MTRSSQPDLVTNPEVWTASGPGRSSVQLLADSYSATASEQVTRLASYEVTGWRFTLAEWNTHCSFARNSASSRAIPVATMLAAYDKHPAYPHAWPSERPGMSGGPPLWGEDLIEAKELLAVIHHDTFAVVRDYVKSRGERPRLHKSVLNRVLEPFLWHKFLVTLELPATNFFRQRADKSAQPEFRVLAEIMGELARAHTPTWLTRGDWHLPYLRPDEVVDGTVLSTIGDGEDYPDIQTLDSQAIDAREVSIARCARTSTGRQHDIKSYANEVAFFRDVLVGSRPPHASPLEHVCTPDPANEIMVHPHDPDTNKALLPLRVAKVGKFRGWQSYRHVIEGRAGYDSYS